MKKMFYVATAFLIAHSSFAGCDPTKFRWGCNMNANVVEKTHEDNLIYCGSTRVYVSKNQFAMLERYQRAGIHMHLLVDDVFYDGPCQPQTHDISHQMTNRF